MNRYKETKIRKSKGRGDTYKISLLDPFPKNVSVLTTYTPRGTERYDTIAHKFYGDSSKWYIIARANKDVNGNLHPQPNKILVIPRID